jgi:Rab guanine nucleotide exchange factor SEC2
MATVVATAPAPPHLNPPVTDVLNTIPDPRTPSTSSVVSRNDSVSDATSQPELNEEIAKLSEKLIDSINHQTSLDDSLQHTRHELEKARREIAKLLAQTQEHEKKVSDGLLITKEEVERRDTALRVEVKTERDRQIQKVTAERDSQVQKIKTECDRQVEAEKGLRVKAENDKKTMVQAEKDLRIKAENDKIVMVQAEKELRLQAEKDKKSMEQELETLTSALFQEANKMVADARKEKEVSDKKVDQLKSQIRDTEVLLESQQEQLVDLKGVLEKMTSEPGDNDSITRGSSNAPSSPTAPVHDRMSRMFESAHFHPPDNAEEVIPDHPLHFSHIIQPVLRTDINAFEDFTTVLRAAKAASPAPSRVASGSYGSLNILSNGPSGSSTPQSPSPYSTNPALRINNSSPRSSAIGMPPLPLLRETKMFKRALVEDIEPTLRLDIAPGVSWMVRRAVLNSLIDGSLVVEPMPPPPVKFRGPVNSCALCGENRTADLYTRRHRFRISEDREKKPFPLCDLCLGRLRSCGDLLSFLRMVSNGHWKADAEDEVKSAWEEYVKLRERMFWHRISGGVIPTTNHTKEPKDTKDTPPLPPRANGPPPLPPRENTVGLPTEEDRGGNRDLEDPFRRFQEEATNQPTEELKDGATGDIGRQRSDLEPTENASTPNPAPSQ